MELRKEQFAGTIVLANVTVETGEKNEGPDSEVKENDNDDLNSPYDGNFSYYYPKQEDYKNKTEYKHDWEVFERFSLNHGSGNELAVIINCTYVYSDNEEIVVPDVKSWKLMNKVYHTTMNKHHANENEEYDSLPAEFQSELSASAEVRLAPGEGRGVFATSDIAEGSVVWKSTNTAEFRSGNAFRKFLMELATHDKQAACNAIEWAYVVKASPSEYTICIDLDEGGIFNDGMGLAADTNVGGIDFDVQFGCSGRSLYAMRNIPSGAQLKVDYGTFVEEQWNMLGVCNWGESPPPPGCERAASMTFLKDEGIKNRVAYRYEDETQ
eukprot:jgi/Psemu1/312699/fgenesh1_kg.1004_\